jgi:hypothetical protein
MLTASNSMNASQYLNNLSVFNIMDMTWTNLEPSGSRPAPRGFMGFTLMREKIYVFGGLNNQGNSDVFWCQVVIKADEFSGA